MITNFKPPINIFWFRRDLRLDDNAGLYYALKTDIPVLPLFIFDRTILDKLDDKEDARVTFIYKSLENLNDELKKYQSSLLIKYNTAEKAWNNIVSEYNVKNVFTNHDYEPFATKRDNGLKTFFKSKNIGFYTYKDQVIFEKNEVLKDDQKPYTVFSPYKRKWLELLKPDFHLRSYPTEKYAGNLFKEPGLKLPSLADIGFKESTLEFPDKEYKDIIADYAKTRDYPDLNGTSRISVHLRFGTVSIRRVALDAWQAKEHTWLSELIWRDFYAMIFWHFPDTAHKAFKAGYDQINWRNDEAEFKAWCDGTTGYPIVDAGMRQLNTLGWMHNRVRMITASFLTKHLLIDWRWGEAYFAKKLIDYDQASNIGGWQWAASSGNDAVPYFRILNPELQVKRFDPKFEYIKKWVPEFNDAFKYPKPIIEHKTARERVLKEFERALKS